MNKVANTVLYTFQLLIENLHKQQLECVRMDATRILSAMLFSIDFLSLLLYSPLSVETISDE